jgi:glycosyltransferase involved in cell wall biosynthesis
MKIFTLGQISMLSLAFFLLCANLHAKSQAAQNEIRPSITTTCEKLQPKRLKRKEKEPLWEKLKNFQPQLYRKFLIIIPSYNNKEWYKRNLDSVFMQDYPFYQVIYIDDCSPDGTGDLVKKYINKMHKKEKVLLVKNKERRLALANYYTAIHAYGQDDDIALVLDGDDWFAHDHVLSLINKVYEKFDVWITYGQHKQYPSGYLGIAKKLPAHIIKTNSFRDYPWVTSQQRTFYVWLFKLIKIEDLLYDGKFFSVAGDLGTMFPMLEMAGTKSTFIPDVIYIYNRATPLNNSKVHPGSNIIRDFIRQKERYDPIKKRPM